MTINVWNGKNENKQTIIDNKTISVWSGKNKN